MDKRLNEAIAKAIEAWRSSPETAAKVVVEAIVGEGWALVNKKSGSTEKEYLAKTKYTVKNVNDYLKLAEKAIDNSKKCLFSDRPYIIALAQVYATMALAAAERDK